jgi:acetyl esterase/lipase
MFACKITLSIAALKISQLFAYRLAFASILLTLGATKCIGDDSQSKIRVEHNVVYACFEDIELICDVYSPAQTVEQSNYPAALVIHGGAWSSGSKTMMAGYASKLAQAGIVTVAINYRHAPTHKFPAQVDDVREALIWLNDNAVKYAIDLSRIGLFGYSAGAHLACMLATLQDEPMDRILTTSTWEADDPRWERLPSVTAVVAGGPPCEFRTIPPQNAGLSFFLGSTREQAPEVYEAASPVSFASEGDCPVCFIHGERDFIVPIQSSRSLYDAQVEAGVPSEFVMIEKQGHMFTFLHSKTQETMLEYMKRNLLTVELPLTE